ncbi:MAG: MarR family winged helix-turn-helix transcriptional regulator [Myxococcota bacterium]
MSRPPWDPADSTSFWVNRASRALLRLQDRRLRSLGFGMAQMPVLHALGAGAALTQKELAARAGVDQPTMSELLARMERSGIVHRTPNPDDARGALVSLTPEALARLPEAKDALVDVEILATADLTPEERTVLRGLLERVARSVS